MAEWTTDDIDRLTRAAVEAEIADKSRRSLLLGGLTRVQIGKLLCPCAVQVRRRQRALARVAGGIGCHPRRV